MQAGKLRHLITIKTQSTEKDSRGQLKGWVVFSVVRASVEPLRGREFILSEKEQAEVDTRIRVRYLAGIKPKMRVKFGDKTYNIKSVIAPEERSREIELMCVEVI